MRWPAAHITSPDRRATTHLLVFAAAELVLAMAIPFLLIRGYHTLLSSNAGTFVDGPTINEEGWSALVSATPLTAVIEVVDGRVSGAVVLVPASESASMEQLGGTVVLIPGDLVVAPGPDGDQAVTGESIRLADVAAGEVGGVVAELLNIKLTSTQIMDERAWVAAFGSSTYEVDNPDPIPDAGVEAEAVEDDTLAFVVGSMTVAGADAAIFLGRPVEDGSLSSVTPRRRQLWTAMMVSPPSGDHPLVPTLGTVAVNGQIVDLPTVRTNDETSIDAVGTETLLRDIVAFPAGDRLAARIVDRTGAADLELVAAQLAGRGIEIVEIANAVAFDEGSTELIRPADLTEGARSARRAWSRDRC